MASYLWRKYADYVYTKWERTILWDMVDPYRRPKSFTPLVTIYIAAFYTGVIGSAITEQLYKDKHTRKLLFICKQVDYDMKVIVDKVFRKSTLDPQIFQKDMTDACHREKYWEDHPGEAVPLMKPKFYGGPWRVIRGEALGSPPTEPAK